MKPQKKPTAHSRLFTDSPAHLERHPAELSFVKSVSLQTSMRPTPGDTMPPLSPPNLCTRGRAGGNRPMFGRRHLLIPALALTLAGQAAAQPPVSSSEPLLGFSN